MIKNLRVLVMCAASSLSFMAAGEEVPLSIEVLTAKDVIDISQDANMKTSVDFGEMQAATKYRLAFDVKNSSGEGLLVTDITTSCGCMTQEASGGVVGSGEMMRIEILFSSPPLAGKIAKEATIHLRNGSGVRLSHRILLVGSISPRFRISSETLVYSETDGGLRAPQTLSLRAVNPIDCREIRVDLARGMLSVASFEKQSHKGEWEISLVRTPVMTSLAVESDILRIFDVGSNSLLAALPLKIDTNRSFDVRPRDFFVKNKQGKLVARVFLTTSEEKIEGIKVSSPFPEINLAFSSVQQTPNGVIAELTIENWNDGDTLELNVFGAEGVDSPKISLLARRPQEVTK